MSELTAKEYFNIKNRMVKRKDGECSINCLDCPLSFKHNPKHMFCHNLEVDYPDEAIAIVEEWAKEHSIETNLTHYAKELRKLGFEVNDTALSLRCPIPRSNRYSFSGEFKCPKGSCTECRKWWNEEYVPSAQ